MLPCLRFPPMDASRRTPQTRPSSLRIIDALFVKRTIQLIFSLIFAGAHMNAAPAVTQYSGKTAIEGLGTIVLPAGEWILELQSTRPAADTPQHRDYFIFRRAGSGLVERITFLRYSPKYSLPLSHMLDSLMEGLGNGIPPEEHGSTRAAGWTAHPMRLEPRSPKPEDREIDFSFIQVPTQSGPPWLCHAHLFSSDGCAFVIVHASQTVTSPETVVEIRQNSHLDRIK